MYRKYKAKKIEVDGMVFDSKKEYKRWTELVGMEHEGVISDLKRQVEFELIPQYREADKIGPKGGIKRGKIIEYGCSYIADFTYMCNGQYVVEDSKGFKTPEYKIKRKLMYHIYKIRVKES